ncbi:type B 50S ribosomal protein L31 [Amycolatopsis sp. FDAARGOS 1241]|uniref:type B 50S ribosomal protein L31 n=1 Tax=Amycolatopsis sp. FDAARGOS 1241 TaxID=2778070 RepID=UPI00195237A0|nr:type B 50S ribosomal protein L31 [Amycolatopsis sp. FDAARGOS 1241]QRP49618.1 type B 50S ribosomal protein L31 [Amycolatopsis sp. FDAARGOS 1241]
MKPGIHPDYHPVVFRDSSTGDAFRTRSTATSDRTIEWSDGTTYPLVVVDISAWSHPFWTGNQRIVDSAGQVEKFHRRYGRRDKGGTGQDGAR